MKKILAVLALAAASAAHAQSYPVKPIRLVVPFAPGGSSSIVARSVATEMSKALGQEIYIENKGGGGGNLAMHDVARAEPDGYTLIIGHIGSLALTPFIGSTPQEYAEFIAREQARWKEVIQKANIKAD